MEKQFNALTMYQHLYKKNPVRTINEQVFMIRQYFIDFEKETRNMLEPESFEALMGCYNMCNKEYLEYPFQIFDFVYLALIKSSD